MIKNASEETEVLCTEVDNTLLIGSKLKSEAAKQPTYLPRIPILVTKFLTYVAVRIQHAVYYLSSIKADCKILKRLQPILFFHVVALKIFRRLIPGSLVINALI